MYSLYRPVILFMFLLLAFAYKWSEDIFARFRQDIAAVRTTDDSVERGVIIFYWALTLLIFSGIGCMIYACARFLQDPYAP